MDMDEHSYYPRGQHGPPVLFQSDDHDHRLDRRNRHPSPLHPLSFGPSDDSLMRHQYYSHSNDNDHEDSFGFHLGEEMGVSEGAEEEPVHVHSQACQDSCPVQDIYTEASFTRFSKGARTNIYGLVVLKELENALPPPSTAGHDQGLSAASTGTTPLASDGGNGSCIFTSNGDIAYNHLPARYVLVAAGGIIKCFMGLQESFELTLEGAATTVGAAVGTEAAAGVSMPGTAMGPEATATEGGAAMSAPVLNQEIISMDAFVRKDGRGSQLVLVVSLAKGEEPVQFELRVYGANSFGSSIQDLLLQLPNTTDVQSIPLSWAPTKIIHAPLEHDPFDMAILVAGSDSCVHIFAQNESQPNSSEERLFEEQLIETHFPILASFPYCEYCVLSLVIKDYPTCRIVAAGTQNGTLNIGVIPRDLKTLKLNRARAKSHTVVLFAPITTLTVFTSRVQAERRRRRQSGYHMKDGQDQRDQSEKVGQYAQEVAGTSKPQEDMENDGNYQQDEPGIHVLVTCAIEQAWIYSDINKHGLSRRSDLAECSYHDSILAAHIMDADWDGRNEIIVGTYGRQLMVFKEIPPAQSSYKSASIPIANHPHPPQQYHHASAQPDAPLPTLPVSQWGMTWNRRFATPVYGISSADLNDDGLEELVVTTLNGVSFFLPDPSTAKRRLDQAVERMREIEEMKVMLAKLRMSNEELWEMQRLKEQRQHEEKKEEEKKNLGKEAEEQGRKEMLEGKKRMETDTEDVRQSEERFDREEQVESERKQPEQLTRADDGVRDDQAEDGARKEQVEDGAREEQVNAKIDPKEKTQDMELDDLNKKDLMQESDIVGEIEHEHIGPPFGDTAADEVVSDDHEGQWTNKKTEHDNCDDVEDVKASSPQGDELAE